MTKKKKIVIYSIIGVLLLIPLSLYVVLFTPPGNIMLTPLVESKINANLKHKIVITLFRLTPSNIVIEAELAKDSTIKCEGSYSMFDKSFDINYNIKIANLADIEKLTSRPLNGPLSTSGNAKGDINLINISGTTDIAESDTDYTVTLNNLKPASAVITMKHAKLAKILYMAQKPIYADASLDLYANFATLTLDNISGDITTSLKQGRTFPETLQKEFDFEDADITFTATTETKIEKSISTTKTDIDSSIGTLKTDKTVYNLNKKEFDSDFSLILPDLDKLFFVTKKHLKGKITATGNLKQNEQDFILDTKLKTLGGDLTLLLKNDDLLAEFKKVKTTQICYTLLYPQVFESELYGTVAYNLKTKKGTVKTELLNGNLIENELTKIIKTASKYDITQEMYQKTKIDALINDKIIKANMIMTSKKTEITAKNALINLEDESIKTTLIFLIKKQKFEIKVKGSLKKPSLTLKTKALIKQELKKVIDKKVPKKYRKDLNKILDLF